MAVATSDVGIGHRNMMLAAPCGNSNSTGKSKPTPFYSRRQYKVRTGVGPQDTRDRASLTQR
jgi:hypothetical protein